MHDDVYNTKQGFTIPEEHIPSEEDMKRLADGEEGVVTELINGLILFVVNEVDWFLKCTPTAKPYEEDCVSEAMLSLTKFVNNSKGKPFEPKEFMGHLKRTCINDIIDYLQNISVAVTISKGTRRNKDVKQEQIDLTHRANKDVDLFEELWFKEFIASMTKREQEVIRLKISGLSNAKIADQVGVSGRLVSDILEQLKNRYEGNE